MDILQPIIAIATPPVSGAVGIVRLSGQGVIALCDLFFVPKRGGVFSEMPPRTLILGDLFNEERQLLDRPLAVHFPAGSSYTGEEVAEIHAHGGLLLLQSIVSLFLSQGVRLAAPGEFTKRAFLNGRMSLSQAEAVADVIHADNAAAIQNALGQLSGALHGTISAVRQSLTALAAHFSAWMDYVEEGVEPPELPFAAATIAAAQAEVARLIDSYSLGQTLKDGVPTAIVGKPNVGKSSVLNRLIGYERAIVTHIPGTTRDIVEESISIGGQKLRLLDTAGIRETDDLVEQIGVRKSRGLLREALLRLAVFDASMPLELEDISILNTLRGQQVLVLLNKCDLPIAADLTAFDGFSCVRLSALTGDGLQAVRQEIARIVTASRPTADGQTVTSLRQHDCLLRTAGALRGVLLALEAGMTPDVLLTDLLLATDILGELTGECVTDLMIDAIFSTFCVGK